MIPIPLWFRPWMLKASAVVVLISLIFFAGCRVQKQMDMGKIERIRTNLETTEANYDQCLEMLVRSEDNYDSLQEMVNQANAEVDRLHAEYQDRVIALRRTSQAAIDNINRTHRQSMQELVEENLELQERFSVLTQAEKTSPEAPDSPLPAPA